MKNLNTNKELRKNLLKSAQKEMNQLQEIKKGWYNVTITGTAIKLLGNNAPVTKTVRTLADCRLNAYNNAVLQLQNKPIGNILSFISFESPTSCIYEFLGDKVETEVEIFNH